MKVGFSQYPKSNVRMRAKYVAQMGPGDPAGNPVQHACTTCRTKKSEPGTGDFNSIPWFWMQNKPSLGLQFHIFRRTCCGRMVPRRLVGSTCFWLTCGKTD